MTMPEDSSWCTTLEVPIEELEAEVPESLQELIEHQFTELDEPLQRVLETACVVGRTFSVAAVAGALPLPDDEVETLCEELTSQGRFLRLEG